MANPYVSYAYKLYAPHMWKVFKNFARAIRNDSAHALAELLWLSALIEINQP